MDFNRYFDHTLLRPDAGDADIETLCLQAVEYGFHSVVVNPCRIARAAVLVAGSPVRVCSVAGFPLGAAVTDIKIAEALRAEDDGAAEIDVVANIGWLQEDKFDDAARELEYLRKRLSQETLLKVIVETPLLNPDRWESVVETVVRSKAEYIKTATGFFGATTRRHVEQLSRYAGGRIHIKAAGGIRTAADALAMIMSGASRIGCSASTKIADQYRAQKSDTR